MKNSLVDQSGTVTFTLSAEEIEQRRQLLRNFSPPPGYDTRRLEQGAWIGDPCTSPGMIEDNQSLPAFLREAPPGFRSLSETVKSPDSEIWELKGPFARFHRIIRQIAGIEYALSPLAPVRSFCAHLALNRPAVGLHRDEMGCSEHVSHIYSVSSHGGTRHQPEGFTLNRASGDAPRETPIEQWEASLPFQLALFTSNHWHAGPPADEKFPEGRVFLAVSITTSKENYSRFLDTKGVKRGQRFPRLLAAPC